MPEKCKFLTSAVSTAGSVEQLMYIFYTLGLYVMFLNYVYLSELDWKAPSKSLWLLNMLYRHDQPYKHICMRIITTQ